MHVTCRCRWRGRRCVWLAAVPWLLLAPLAAAEAAALPPPVVQLQPVFVVPSPLPGPGIDAARLPYLVQDADADDIARVQPTNLADFMQRELTGVDINNVQGSPFQTDLTYHGFRASPTLGAAQGISVYLDGVRVNEPFGDIVSWDAIPEAAIAHVTLVPGSNPLFGLNTLGGALVLQTQSGLTDPGFHANLSYGSDERRRVDLSYGVSNAEGWHAFIAGTHFDEDGWRDASHGQVGNLFGKLGRHTEANDWDVSVLHVASRLLGNGLLPAQRWDEDSGEDLPGLYQADRRAIYTAPDLTLNHVTQLTVHETYRFSEQTQLSALAYTRHSSRDTVGGDVNDDYEDYVEDCGDGFDAGGAPLDDDCDYTRAEGAALPNAVLNTSQTRQSSQGVGVNLSHHGGAHQLTFGVTYDRSDVSYNQYTQDAWLDMSDRSTHADPTAPREFFSGVSGGTHATGVFASDTWHAWSGGDLTGSLRWNRVLMDNALSTADTPRMPGEHFSYTKLNPALGVVQALGGGWRIFANAAQSNRVPTVIEMGCADPQQPCTLPTGLQADPYLKQVVSRAYTLGTRWHGPDGLALSVDVYRTTNRHDILFLRAPNTQQGYFTNFDRTRNQGADIDLGQHLQTLDWHLGYSYLQATYQAYGQIMAGERVIDVHPGMRIAGLPRHTLKLDMDWQFAPRWRVGGDLSAVSSTVANGNEDGRIDDDDPSVRRDWGTGGYAIVNLRASYRPSPHIELYAHVDNVFDRRYESYAAVADDILPNGHLIQPQVAPGESAPTRFVAPGAPRLYGVGVRLDY